LSYGPRPALACAGAGCLAVYSDPGDEQIRGAFIAADNKVLPSFLISTDAADPQQPAGGPQISPAVAFDGTSYVVVWRSLDPNAPMGSQIRGARVALNGTVLDPGGVEIGAPGVSPQISARAGSPALVTWASPVMNESIHAALVDTAAGITLPAPGGVPLIISGAYVDVGGMPAPIALDSTDAEGLVVRSVMPEISTIVPRGDVFASVVETSSALTSASANNAISKNWNYQMGPAVTFSSKTNRYLVVWKDSEYIDVDNDRMGLAVASLNDKGEVLSTDQLAFYATPPSFTAILSAAAGPDNILIGWLESEPFNLKALNLKAMLAGHDGELSSPTPILIPTDEVQSDFSQLGLSAAFHGSAYVLVWSTGARVRASRLSAGGDVLEADVLVHESLGDVIRNVVSTEAGGGDFLTFWSSDFGIFCKSFSTASGKISVSSGAPTMIAELSNAGTQLSVASGDDGAALVVWSKHTEISHNDLNGTRVNKSCERLDGGFTIAEDDTFKVSPRVIFDGASYLASWTDGSETYGAWISRAGMVHPMPGFLVAEKDGLLGGPVIASDGAGRSLVAFTRSHFTDENGLRFDVERVRVKLINNDCKYPDVVSCQPEDACRVAGACDPETLKCSPSSPQPDGAPCPGGLCIGGDCVPDSILPASSGASVGASGGGNPIEGDGGCACEAVGAGRRGGAPAGLFAAIAALLATSRAGRARRGRSAYT